MPKLVIVIEGGVIQDLIADAQINIAVIDYDADEHDPEDLFDLYETQAAGYLDTPEVSKKQTNELYALVKKHDERE